MFVYVHFHFCRLFPDIQNSNFGLKLQDEGKELWNFFFRYLKQIHINFRYLVHFRFQVFSWHKYQFRPQASRWRAGVTSFLFNKSKFGINFRYHIYTFPFFRLFSWHKYQFRPQASRWRAGVPRRRSNLMSMPRLCSEQFYNTKIQKQAKYS